MTDLSEYDGLDRLWEDPDAEPDKENDLMTLQEERDRTCGHDPCNRTYYGAAALS